MTNNICLNYKLFIKNLVAVLIIFLSIKIVNSGFKNIFAIVFNTRNLIYFLMLFVLYNYFELRLKAFNLGTKGKVYCFVSSLLFAVLNVFGALMAYRGTLHFINLQDCVNVVFCIIGYSIAFSFFFSVFFYIFRNGYLFKCAKDSVDNKNNSMFLWFVFFFLIFSIWMIWIIAYYPATVDYDTEWQLCSYLGYWPKTNHHPWFSTCVVGLFFELGRNMGDDNYGMFAYIFLRAMCLALIFSKVVLFLKETEVKNSIVIAILLFYAITPVWGAYAKQPFKDTFAAGLFCWFIN